MTSPGPGVARDARLDNARAILIVLVVVGHALALLDGTLADVVYDWLYGFHMPAFVLLAGFLSGPPDERRARRLVTGVVAPFFLFHLVHVLQVWALRGSIKASYVLDPGWTLWFLVALVLWRLSVPIWLALRPWVAIAASFAVALGSGLDADLPGELSLDRFLVLLPCFVLGLLLREWSRDRDGAFPFDRLPRPRLVASAVVVLLSAACWVISARTPTTLVRHTDAYRQMDVGVIEGVALRGLVLVLASVLAVALITAMPARRTWWTHIGVQSMYVYLLHAPILFTLRELDWLEGDVPSWVAALLISGACVLAWVLASRPVARATRWAVEPPLDGILRAPSRTRD